MTAMETAAQEALDWLEWAEQTDDAERRISHLQMGIAGLSKARSLAKKALREQIDAMPNLIEAAS